MIALEAAIHTALVDDVELRSLIGTYKGAPAVFTQPLPQDAKKGLPYVIISGVIADNDFDTSTTRGREIGLNLRCYSQISTDSTDIENIAERLRKIFHRVKVPVGGYKTLDVTVSGPINAPTSSPDLLGRVLALTFTLEEE